MHVVKFNPVSKEAELLVKPPQPASKCLPEWYKKMGAFETQKPEIDDLGSANTTAKLCMPFYDSLSAGYIQETWQDIYISANEEDPENPFYNYPTKPGIISHRLNTRVPKGAEFYSTEFTFIPQWIPELPRGWSMLYTAPLNRMDLPFVMASGFVDSDKFTQAMDNSQMPFYLKKPFTGLIPKGTPMYQMIPIKRSSWKSFAQHYNYEEQLKVGLAPAFHFWGGYKKYFWTKKEYR
jgi:hypothetical protein